jgi:hypothetical protein
MQNEARVKDSMFKPAQQHAFGRKNAHLFVIRYDDVTVPSKTHAV